MVDADDRAAAMLVVERERERSRSGYQVEMDE